MTNHIYHKEPISEKTFLITGGAGFIGSNLVDYLLKHGAEKVCVLDNLSNGYIENIKDFMRLPNFKFIEGDIRDLATCQKALEGIQYVSHQAALGSVPRSINDPVVSNEVNISGFLNMLVAAKDSSTLKKFVYAASSSTYGDSIYLPKVEGTEGKPLSPYAVTKVVNEMYADVFSKVYGFHSIGLRYFNVFGPKQNPENPYAAVIPIFCKHIIEGTSPTINGDGETSRDFTYVENVIQANIKALLHPMFDRHEVFNVACGGQVSLNEFLEILNEINFSNIKAIYSLERVGDVRHSRASIDKINRILGYNPSISFNEGINLTFKYLKKKYESEKNNS